ncbi:MAG: hypothetical protein IPM23_25440 [Candidatus Melainabacteria bacterium]|nr:hypothetical protein [Candidatus Melainabacteria bacterium]
MSAPQKRPRLSAGLLILSAAAFLLVLLAAFGQPAFAQPFQFTTPDSNPMTHWDIRKTYFLRNKAAAQHGPISIDGRDLSAENPEGHDVIVNKESMGPGMVEHHRSGPVFEWPVSIPEAMSEVPTYRDEAIMENLFQTFGYPVSDTQFQIIERYNHNRFLEQLFDPEKVMWMATTISGVQANSAGNSTANMSVNQNITAIEYVRQPIRNFTAEPDNVWQRIRYELFIPMAVLLLLPGAVLAQARAIVAQGSPAIVGEVNPFEGIIKSIMAIFLIPGSFLVINYGIDVSNSIRHTIAEEYQRIFGGDMYEHAKCAIKRAYPINPPTSNLNAIVESEVPDPNSPGADVWAPYEKLSLNLRLYDPCAGLDESRVPDEAVIASKPVNRLLVNGAGATVGLTWNVMCAFQLVYLYYLWCMGPIAAALWVWPIGQLKSAFPNWCEGVIVLCFWSLFWNTVIFLMAAFKGVGDSGTVYITALLLLSIEAVKQAFNFSGLVSGAAGQAAAALKPSGGGGGGASQGGGQGQRGGAAAPGTGTTTADSATTSPTGTPGLPGSPVSPAGLTGGVEGGAAAGSSVNVGASGNLAGATPPGTGADSNADASISGGPGGLDSPGGAKGGMDPGAVEMGPPPGSGGKEDEAGSAASTLAGIAGALGAGSILGSGKGGDGGSNVNNLSYQAMVNRMGQGGDALSQGGDALSQTGDRLNLGGDLDNTLNNARNLLDGNGPPPTELAGLAGAAGTDRLMGGTASDLLGPGAHAADQLIDNAIAGTTGTDLGAHTPIDPLTGNALTAGADAMAGANPLASNPLAGELGLDQVHQTPGGNDILANGIDRDFAGNPQAELAQSCAQDLMRGAGVSDQMLKDALNGDQQAIQSIDQKLGVAPNVLDAALHGDSGSASIAMAAAGHTAMNDPGSALHQAAAQGNMAAQEALKIAPLTDESTIMAAAHGDPLAAGAVLQHNGEATQAMMASAQMTQNELKEAGVTPDLMRSAMQGDVQAQQQVSQAMGMGPDHFDTVRGAFHGDVQDASTVLAAHGRQEMASMTPEQIQQACQQGDASILAAQAAPADVMNQAIAGDEGAKHQLQQAIASNPVMLDAAAPGGSGDAMRAIHAATGERADVMGAASQNAQGVMGLYSSPEQVQQAMSGSAEQREGFINQMADRMHVAPDVLRDAVGGDSSASATVMAMAGGDQQISAMAHSGNVLAQAAVTAAHGQNPDTVMSAARGNESAQFAVQNGMATSPEMLNMARSGHEGAASVMNAVQANTDAGTGGIAYDPSPQTALYAASSETQAAIQDLGVDASAVARGDQTAIQQLDRALNIDPATPAGQAMHSTIDRALHGDGGAAATFMAAAGRTEAVQELARGGDVSAQTAVAAANCVSEPVLSRAMAGDQAAQAMVQTSVASDPQILSMASQGNESAYQAVQAAYGSNADSTVAASADTQQVMSFFGSPETVQTALHGSGATQQGAINEIATNMGITPQVLQGALEGNTSYAAATVAAAGGVAVSAMQAGDAPGISEFGQRFARAAEGGHPLASAAVASYQNLAPDAVNLASIGNGAACDVIRQSMAESPALMQMAAQGNHAASSMLTLASPVSPAVNAGTYQESLAGNMGVRTEAGFTPTVAQDTSGYAQFTQGGGSYETQMAPQAPMYAAAAETQATIQDLGVDPGAVARGDQAAIQQLDRALNVDPGYAQAMHATYDRASHGDPGAAATLMAAAGQTEAVQSLAQSGDPSAIAAVTAAQSVPQDLMTRAVSGDAAAQAMVQSTIARNPDMISLASQGNQTAAQVMQTGYSSSYGYTDSSQVQMYAAAAETQATIQDLGVDPGAIARGDQAAIQQLDRALNVDPGYAQAMHATYDRASHGDPGAAATLMAAAGHTEAVQSLAQSGDPSAIAAVTAAQSVPQDVMTRAVSGDTAAQAMVQSAIASNPDMVSLASQGNQTAAQVLQSGSYREGTAQVQPGSGYQYSDGSGQQYRVDAGQLQSGGGANQPYTASSGGFSSGSSLERAGDVPVSGGSFTSGTSGMSYDHGQPTPPASNLSYAPDGTTSVDPGSCLPGGHQEIRTDSYAGQPASYEHRGGQVSGDAGIAGGHASGGHVPGGHVSGGHVPGGHEPVQDASGASYMPADQRHEPQHHHQTESAAAENADYLAEQQRAAAEQQHHEHRPADEGAWHPDEHRDSWYVGGAAGATPGAPAPAPAPKPPDQPSTFGQALRGALPGIAGGAGLAARAGKGKDGTPQGPGEAKGPPERKDLDMRAGKQSGKSDEQRRKEQADLLKQMEHERQIAEAEQKRYEARSEAERQAAEEDLRRLREEQEGMS